MQGRFALKAAVLRGIRAEPVSVEVFVSSGLPHFAIVGMADAAIQEARERIRAAISSCGFTMPGGRLVVNLAPSSLKKAGSGFDLPIALCILAATKQINAPVLGNTLFVGELSLEGAVKPIKGMLAYEVCAREQGWKLVCAQTPDGLLKLEDLELSIADSLDNFRTGRFKEPDYTGFGVSGYTSDFADIAGNEFAKRALQVAAAGNHGILLMGPPGSGKTMLASRLPSILPPLSERELLQSALIHSVAGEELSSILAGRRPFRSPHHSATLPGLIGGGTPIRPGEISLAHNGVLFLDELAEFKPSTLQGIRQPLEAKYVSITRAGEKLDFPSDFVLVSASNPCPCGHYGDAELACTCSEAQIRTYQARIGGPLLDRISMHVNVWRSPPEDILRSGGGRSSEDLREGVLKARAYRSFRRRNFSREERETPQDLMSSCRLNAEDEHYLKDMARFYKMSGRGLVRTLSVARTIADIEESKTVGREHLSEALELRIRSSD